MENYRYKAFISYSHKDHRWGRWLHRRLENYRIPKHLAKSDTAARLKPIFRDREELTAADNLGDKIEQALAASECLIVICSPQAAKSHWVNQEILIFKRANKGAKIFSLIVEGEPFSNDENGSNNDNECMPPALRFQMGADGELTNDPAEPLAADLRKTGDGKRYGTLKLISGMLGVGLDELVQRDLQKNRNRVTAITVGALTTVLAMGTLTGFAVSARKEAERQSMIAQAARTEADNRRGAAEEMIEFMITELKPELESVGRLKPLSIVGERAAKYYADQPLTAHNDNALGRRARVFHLIGEADDKLGDLDKAQTKFDEAYASTKALLARDPNNPDRVFDHAQSAYWAGYVPYQKAKYDEAEPHFREYITMAERLNVIESGSQRSLQEITYASSVLGSLNYQLQRYNKALEYFKTAEIHYAQLALSNKHKHANILERADNIGWVSLCYEKLNHIELAIQTRLKMITLTQNALQHSSADKWQLKLLLASSFRQLSTLYALNKDYDQSLRVGHLSEIRFMELIKHDPNNSTWVTGLAYSQRVLLDTNKKIGNKKAFDAVLSNLNATIAKLPENSEIRNFPNFQKLTFNQGE